MALPPPRGPPHPSPRPEDLVSKDSAGRHCTHARARLGYLLDLHSGRLRTSRLGLHARFLRHLRRRLRLLTSLTLLPLPAWRLGRAWPPFSPHDRTEPCLHPVDQRLVNSVRRAVPGVEVLDEPLGLLVPDRDLRVQLVGLLQAAHPPLPLHRLHTRLLPLERLPILQPPWADGARVLRLRALQTPPKACDPAVQLVVSARVAPDHLH